MDLVISAAAAEALADLPGKTASAIVARMQAVAANPFAPHPQAKKLTGQAGYRLRVGDWRAIYAIDRAGNRVILEAVKNRKDAYR